MKKTQKIDQNCKEEIKFENNITAKINAANASLKSLNLLKELYSETGIDVVDINSENIKLYLIEKLICENDNNRTNFDKNSLKKSIDDILIGEKLEVESDNTEKLNNNIFEEKIITYAEYYDKVYGCWLGKNLGGCAGAPVEGLKVRIRSDFKDLFDGTIANDDLDFQIMWLEVLETKGPYFNSEDLANIWIDKCWYPFSEYGYFVKNYKRGISAPMSGVFNNEFFKDGMGCPIRSEIWALVAPGLPEHAASMAKIDAELDHGDNSLWGEIYLATIESELFFEKDVYKVFLDCLKYISKESKIYECITKIMEKYNKNYSFECVYKYIIEEFSHPDFTNSVQNIGFIIASVLYGELKMDKTINLALSCGYDADCTCATAGAMVGICNGASGVPDDLKALLNDKYVCGIDIIRRNDSIISFSEDVAKVGLGFNRIYDNKKVIITEIPEDICIPSWESFKEEYSLKVNYITKPAIGVNDKSTVVAIISNNSDVSITGRFRIDGVKKIFNIEYNTNEITVDRYSSKEFIIDISTKNIDIIDQTNIFSLAFENNRKTELICNFGLAGAWPFKVYGPFFDPMKMEHDKSVPHCHNGFDLPPIESMVNNQVLLYTEYYDEAQIINNTENYTSNVIGVINSYEDVIPIEKMVRIEGQCGFYLVGDVFFPSDQSAWVVIGNSDAFIIHLNGEMVKEKDEIRYWTPINNSFIGNFKKGKNRIVIKLLRRTNSLKFSIGLKHFDDKHFHRVNWHTNLSYGVVK